MLYLNLIKLIHPGFLKIIQGGVKNGFFKSEELFENGIFQSKEFINVDVILATSCFPIQIFEGSRLVADFIDLMNNSIEFEHTLQNGQEFTIPLLLLIVTTADAKNVFCNWCIAGNQFSSSQLYDWSMFIERYQDIVKASLEDTEFKDTILNDIIEFITILLNTAEDESVYSLKEFKTQLHPLAPHLTDILCKKMLILALHPKQNDIIFELQQIHFPPLKLFDHPLADRKITTSLFQELTLQALPKRVDVSKWPFLLEFYRFIWKLHLFPHQYSKDCNVGKHVIDIAPDGFDILRQLICFLLPNWFQVWTEMNYSTSIEVQRRLWLLKTKNWTPPIKDFIMLLLNSM